MTQTDPGPLGVKDIRVPESQRSFWVPLLMGLGTAAVFSVGSLLRLRASYGLGFDLGFYLQQVWLLDKGMSVGSMANLPVFADHLSPILYLYLPFADSSYLGSVLVVTQALAVGLTAWFLVVRSSTIDARLRIMSLAYFVLSPALGFAVLFDFHPLIFGMPLLAAILLAIERRHSTPLLVVLVLSGLLIREDIALLAGLLVLVHEWKTPGRRSANVAAFTVITAVLTYVGLSSSLAHQGSHVHARHAWVGELLRSGSMTAFEGVISGYILATVLVVYFPVLFVRRLLRQPTTIMAGGVSLFFMASRFVPADSIYYQYHAVPVFLIAWGLGSAHAEGGGDPGGRARLVVIGSLVAALFLGPFALVSPPIEITDRWLPHIIESQQRSALAELRERIPKDASVSASNTVGPHLAQRRLIYDFPDPLSCEGLFTPSRGGTSSPDYVVVTDLETGDDDIRLIERLGYTAVDRVHVATIYRAPPERAPSRPC